MTDMYQGAKRMTLEAAAVKEQHDVLKKRIRLFGRVTLWQAFVLLFLGFAVVPDTGYSFRSVARTALGQSLVNGLFAMVLLLLYLGIRRQNLLCGIGTLLTCAAAMLSSTFLKVAYSLAEILEGNTEFSMTLAILFLLLFFLPFSVLVLQFPSFLRWKKLKERYQDEVTDGGEPLFEPKTRRFEPVLFLWLILFLAGAGICFKDEMDYRMAWDMSAWERFTVPGTRVSMELPVKGRMEDNDGGVYMVQAGGDRFLITVVCMDIQGENGGEDQPESGFDFQTLSDPVDGIMGTTAYHQTAERQQSIGMAADVYTRTFDAGEKRIMYTVMVFGRTDGNMDETVGKIFDTISIGED